MERDADPDQGPTRRDDGRQQSTAVIALGTDDEHATDHAKEARCSFVNTLVESIERTDTHEGFIVTRQEDNR